MIPRAFVAAWSRAVSWPTLEQVEQDLVLSRLIVEIARHPYLGGELVSRGGTCLHKLYLPSPRRYSEDLDYVRRSGGGIKDLTSALTTVGQAVGMEVRTQIGQHPKVYFRAPFETDGTMMRVKVEVNTFERSPARDLVAVPFAVDSAWFAGGAEVTTFELAEVVATKLRALFQRSKGRDLFDLWLASNELGVSPEDLIDCFGPYRPEGYTARRAELNLREKLARTDFRTDLHPLVSAWPEDYNIDTAAEQLIAEVISRL